MRRQVREQVVDLSLYIEPQYNQFIVSEYYVNHIGKSSY